MVESKEPLPERQLVCVGNQEANQFSIMHIDEHDNIAFEENTVDLSTMAGNSSVSLPSMGIDGCNTKSLCEHLASDVSDSASSDDCGKNFPVYWA